MKILCLDGGGSKGMYTLGVLSEIELLLGKKLSQVFDAIYGTSTGSIIATGLATGMSVADITNLYLTKVPDILAPFTTRGRDKRLRSALDTAFGICRFDSLECDLAVVAMNWDDRQLFVFKTNKNLAYGRQSSFAPGFGCTLAEAVCASCSAFPLFTKKRVVTERHGQPLLADGGFIANNPSMLAYIDATMAAKVAPKDLTIVSVGTGAFPNRLPLRGLLQGIPLIGAIDIINTQLDATANHIAKSFELLATGLRWIRINDSFADAKLATNLLERDKLVLDALQRKGRESFGAREVELRNLLVPESPKLVSDANTTAKAG